MFRAVSCPDCGRIMVWNGVELWCPLPCSLWLFRIETHGALVPPSPAVLAARAKCIPEHLAEGE